MSASDRARSGFGEAEVFDLAILNQVFYCSCHVFDRNLRVNPVLIEQIDGIGPKSLELTSGIGHH
jgi:hypothetical protein